MDWVASQMAPAAMLAEAHKEKNFRLSDLPNRRMYMRRIGVFELTNGEYVGRIATLNFKCKAIIKDNPHRTTPAEPEYIVQHIGADVFCDDLGFAWEKKTAVQGHPYLMVHLDDPSFPKTVVAVLIKSHKNVYNLYWDRVTITEDDIEGQWVHEELQVYIGDLTTLVNPPKQFLIDMYPSLKEVWDPEPD